MSYTDKIFEKAEGLSGLYSISVIEDGVLQTKRAAANQTNNTYSVSKAFTATAIGMLFDAGKLTPEMKIADIFAEELREYAALGIGVDEKWQRVTVDHALRHVMGIENGFLDIDCEDISTYEKTYGTGEDFLRIVLTHPLEHEPGTHNQYSDAAYYLLSRVVTKLSGEELDDFLRTRLFLPLAFDEYAWATCPRGHAMGATGLYIRTQDIAKTASVYLEDGEYQGKRILSKKWVDMTFERGYCISGKGDGYYSKGGMLGQALMVDTVHHLAVGWEGFETERHHSSVLTQAIREL